MGLIKGVVSLTLSGDGLSATKGVNLLFRGPCFLTFLRVCKLNLIFYCFVVVGVVFTFFSLWFWPFCHNKYVDTSMCEILLLSSVM